MIVRKERKYYLVIAWRLYDGRVYFSNKSESKVKKKQKNKSGKVETIEDGREGNKAGYVATPVACGWAGAIIEVSGKFGQEQ